ncbi:MAG: YhjD/YihY/BrkB family envelope integrity protein [Acidimicrobiales bacterium]
MTGTGAEPDPAATVTGVEPDPALEEAVAVAVTGTGVSRRIGVLQLGLGGWKRAVWHALLRSGEDRVTTSAGSLAFHWFLAIFPAAVALIGLAGLVGLSPSQLRSVIHGARVILPTQMSNLLDQALRNPLGQQASVEALVIGTAVALWSSVEAMAALQVGWTWPGMPG